MKVGNVVYFIMGHYDGYKVLKGKIHRIYMNSYDIITSDQVIRVLKQDVFLTAIDAEKKYNKLLKKYYVNKLEYFKRQIKNTQALLSKL